MSVRRALQFAKMLAHHPARRRELERTLFGDLHLGSEPPPSLEHLVKSSIPNNKNETPSYFGYLEHYI